MRQQIASGQDITDNQLRRCVPVSPGNIMDGGTKAKAKDYVRYTLIYATGLRVWHKARRRIHSGAGCRPIKIPRGADGGDHQP